MRKLDLENLNKVAGGTPDECIAYLDELCAQYGLAPGDYGTLDPLLTEEQQDRIGDLFWKDVDLTGFPGL